jgi:hypothetical protein
LLSTQGPNFTLQDIDLLRWNYEETAVICQNHEEEEATKHGKEDKTTKILTLEVHFPDNLNPTTNKDTKRWNQRGTAINIWTKQVHALLQRTALVMKTRANRRNDFDRTEIDHMRDSTRTNKVEEERTQAQEQLRMEKRQRQQERTK